MIDTSALKNLLHGAGLQRRQKLLLCLGVSPLAPRKAADVRSIAVGAGLTAAKKWNISDVLAELPGLAVRTSAGWELTDAGRVEVGNLAGATVVPAAASKLRTQAAKIASADVRAFVEEAIGCVEQQLDRAAVVLSWVGALAVMYDHVVAKHLTAFNIEAKRRNPKWKDAKTADDLALMDEYIFLQVLQAISVLGKSVKTELEGCLKLRNGCGHPNSLKVGPHRVNSHVETLILNVFTQF